MWLARTVPQPWQRGRAWQARYAQLPPVLRRRVSAFGLPLDEAEIVERRLQHKEGERAWFARKVLAQQLRHNHGWSGAQIARHLGITVAEAGRLLGGQQLLGPGGLLLPAAKTKIKTLRTYDAKRQV